MDTNEAQEEQPVAPAGSGDVVELDDFDDADLPEWLQ